jgi:hypothetical protein
MKRKLHQTKSKSTSALPNGEQATSYAEQQSKQRLCIIYNDLNASNSIGSQNSKRKKSAANSYSFYLGSVNLRIKETKQQALVVSDRMELHICSTSGVQLWCFENDVEKYFNVEMDLSDSFVLLIRRGCLVLVKNSINIVDSTMSLIADVYLTGRLRQTESRYELLTSDFKLHVHNIIGYFYNHINEGLCYC